MVVDGWFAGWPAAIGRVYRGAAVDQRHCDTHKGKELGPLFTKRAGVLP